MSEDQETIYQQGYNAYLCEEMEHSNPYDGIDAEYWSDGWEDAKEDEQQRARK